MKFTITALSTMALVFASVATAGQIENPQFNCTRKGFEGDSQYCCKSVDHTQGGPVGVGCRFPNYLHFQTFLPNILTLPLGIKAHNATKGHVHEYECKHTAKDKGNPYCCHLDLAVRVSSLFYNSRWKMGSPGRKAFHILTGYDRALLTH